MDIEDYIYNYLHICFTAEVSEPNPTSNALLSPLGSLNGVQLRFSEL